MGAAACGGRGRGALQGQGPQRRPQKRLDRWLEGVAKAVGGGYCRLQMPLRLALGVRGTVAGHRLGALEGGEGASNASLGGFKARARVSGERQIGAASCRQQHNEASCQPPPPPAPTGPPPPPRVRAPAATGVPADGRF